MGAVPPSHHPLGLTGTVRRAERAQPRNLGVVGRWTVETWAEPPAAFHHRDLPEPLVPTIWVCRPTVPTLVLGSAQPEAVVDQEACARAGVAVTRRRSGGGAVLVEPERMLWLDVLIPAGDLRWERDIGRAFLWLGEAWAEALASLGVAAAGVHRGALRRTRWSDLVCFGGLGSGEVTLGDGPKIVGLSQRRTRAGARFQCAALGVWDPGAILALLALAPQERSAALEDLAGVAAGVPVRLDALERAVLATLHAA